MVSVEFAIIIIIGVFYDVFWGYFVFHLFIYLNLHLCYQE